MRQIFPAPERDLSAQADSQPITDLGAVYAYPEGTWLRANMIASLDGAVSVAGRSGGLSGPADKLVFKVLRSLADVIVVGAGTARAEHYGPARNLYKELRPADKEPPPIVVVSATLSLDLDSELLRSNRTIVLTTRQAPPERVAKARETADVVVIDDDHVPASTILDELTGRGYRKILVEGGPTLLGQFAAVGLLDELCLTTSPLLEGGYAARILAAPEAARPTFPVPLTLASVLEDNGFLLCRYVRQ